jgi:hypothetical protein
MPRVADTEGLDRKERRRWLVEALIYELGDRTEARVSTRLHALLDSGRGLGPDLDPILIEAGGLSAWEANRVRWLCQLPAHLLGERDLDELEGLLVKTTSGYRLLATEAGRARLWHELRARARACATRLSQDGSNTLGGRVRACLASVAALPDAALTETMVRDVHRLMVEVGT